jgi:hypothetical protein
LRIIMVVSQLSKSNGIDKTLMLTDERRDGRIPVAMNVFMEYCTIVLLNSQGNTHFLNSRATEA